MYRSGIRDRIYESVYLVAAYLGCGRAPSMTQGVIRFYGPPHRYVTNYLALLLSPVDISASSLARSEHFVARRCSDLHLLKLTHV